MISNILPEDVIALVKKEGESLDFGTIRLKIFLRNGNPRWDISRSRSVVNDFNSKGIDANYPITEGDLLHDKTQQPLNQSATRREKNGT